MVKSPPRLLIVISIFILLTFGTFFAIKFAKGYRPSFKSKTLQGTGLLSANSFPTGASVFINQKLTTATDDTLNLPPGEYQVKIAKDGYIPWEKTLQLQAELVTQTNTRLFPAVPDLKPLTFSGALNPIPSPDGQKIVFAVNNATTDVKNGLYILDLLDRPFSLKSDPRQIVRNSSQFDFIQAQLTWSPNSSEILATINPDKPNQANILLNINSFNDADDYKDVTAQLPIIITEWNELLDKKYQERLLQLPDFFQQIATQSASMFFWSPDEEKLMYTATASAQIPENLITPLPASSTQPEQRALEPNNLYIYDIKEDKNFLITAIPSITPTDSPLSNLSHRYSPITLHHIQWYPDSSHVIIIESDKLIISEYDATNQHIVYAGPFTESFVFPWPNGSRLITLISFNDNSDMPPNLYSINLK